ncbi:MAG TPA: LysE family transporter [Clostridiaceae bacterium]|nr:LysE family transporter [Clostridiaceae bacterium]
MVFKGFRFGMLLQIAVGPVCLFIFQTAASSGFAAAETGVLGVAIADALFIAAAILGIGALISRYPKAEKSLKYFGAAVQLVFGISIIAGVFGFSLVPSLDFFQKQSAGDVFIKALLLTLSSPLTILFWAGVFSSKISEENMLRRDMYFFGLGAVLSTLFFLTFVSILGRLVNSFLNPDLLSALNVVVGLMLIGFGIKTALKSG